MASFAGGYRHGANAANEPRRITVALQKREGPLAVADFQHYRQLKNLTTLASSGARTGFAARTARSGELYSLSTQSPLIGLKLSERVG
jgi:hypothetical protein